ncbi:energy-coupled thiamine transporter ThiT [Natranaerobius thermophilus]|uniref:energy-coupled thiamine transporter ThiT n=1 Tax=Natranaerobius thermophilus TaxID=375929 RepID=UPI002F3F73E6
MENVSKNVRILAETGIAVALALLLSMIKLYTMPQGGSVSLEMLPIFIIAFRWGLKPGILAGVTFGTLQLAVAGFIVHWIQFFLDYPVAFAGLGLAGTFSSWIRKANSSANIILPIVTGVILGGMVRFVSHFLAGAVFFGDYAPEGQSVWMYSLLYNSSYLVPELIITIIVIVLLTLTRVKKYFTV